ncbi:MAG TPA: tripartite tricarboxylate transporter substrate binding protein [Eoetvoesiella sp.]
MPASLRKHLKLWPTILLALSVNTLFVANATAQDTYPSKAVTIVSPFSAGGGTDFIARLLASELAKGLGQTVVVENRPGANGMIGSDYVAKARPDGYTLVLGTVGTHGINQAVYDKVPYDTIKDFAPISLIARTPMLVLANPGVKANNVRELVEEARKKSEPMIFSSAGVGSVGHVAGELFAQEAGVKLLHAPYKGAAPAAVDLVGGQVPLMFGTPVSTAQYVSSGKVKILGVTSAHRSKLVPEVPTLNEQGFKDFDVSTWYGLLAPANTPPAIVQLLAQKTKAFLADPQIQQQLLQQGLETVGNSPEEFTKLINAEVSKWAKVSIPK